jgi:hypothetical protein
MVNLKKIGPKSLAELEAIWATLYEDVYEILGSTAVIVAMGDPKQGQPTAATFLTQGLIPATNEFTFTWSDSGGPAAFGTSFDLTLPSNFQGLIPAVTFDGVGDEADTPDAAYWSRDDTSGEGWSVGGWFNVTDTAAVRAILERYDNTTASSQREWEFHITADDDLALRARDESAGVTVQRVSDNPINLGVWTFLVATYDGTGGASAMDTVILYEEAS